MADGLFDGSMDWLSQIFGPNAANAANALGPNGAPNVPLTADALAGSQQANDMAVNAGDLVRPVQPVKITPDLPGAPEVNPNPVTGVPMPRPNPLQPAPEQIASAVRTGLPRPDANPEVVPPPAVPLTSGDGSVGAALTGKTDTPAGTSGATDVSARAKTPEDKKLETLATMLKGIKAPADPVLQKISTPAAPRPTSNIKSGDLQSLLLALNAGAPN